LRHLQLWVVVYCNCVESWQSILDASKKPHRIKCCLLLLILIGMSKFRNWIGMF